MRGILLSIGIYHASSIVLSYLLSQEHAKGQITRAYHRQTCRKHDLNRRV